MAGLLPTQKTPKPKTAEYFSWLKELDGVLVVMKVLILTDKSSHQQHH